MKKVAPYGSWLSPIKADLLASKSVGLGSLKAEGKDIYWVEGRPLESGRNVIVHRTPDGKVNDVTPAGFNARTTVHEYGGGAYLVHGKTVFFSNFTDQRLYRQDPGSEPQAITPEPELPWGLRYADGRVTPDGCWIICVRQHHQLDGEVINELVALPLDGSEQPHAVASGHDFYSSPRLSPGGHRLAWLCWDHPQMPWDGCELWVADLSIDGHLSHEKRVAGGPEESIYQPEWSSDGTLYFVSDRSGWWNLYRLNKTGTEPVTGSPEQSLLRVMYRSDDGVIESVAPMEAEFGQPQWVFGMVNYLFLRDGRVACIYSQKGIDYLSILTPASRKIKPVELGYTSLDYPAYDGDWLWLISASPTTSPTVISLNLADGNIVAIRRSQDLDIDPGYVSIPRPILFPTEGVLTAYAFYYPPANKDYEGPPDEHPPLLVESHGGPTGATQAIFSLSTQYWTSRGFGVVDVNYGGSSGYGRPYRQRLNGQWGVVDVVDCINAARYLIAEGEVDGKRIAVRGGSAGGYTTLCGLAFYDFFKAGASYFGLADLEPFVQDTHKFESRYLDRLVGPYSQAKDLYWQRSPVHYADQIRCPVILFQGLEDKIVPPSQAEIMVRALKENGIPYAYLAYEGEQHGFRKAETIRRCAEAELYFYSRVFNFMLPETVEPVEIKNL